MGLLIRRNNPPEDNHRLSQPNPAKPLLSVSAPNTTHLDDDRLIVSPVVDTSASTTHVSHQVNQCVGEMKEILTSEPAIGRRVDLQLVEAGGTANMVIPATPIFDAIVPQYSAGGSTPLGEAALMSLDGIDEYVKRMRATEVSVVSRILLIVSDGGANDDRQTLEEAKRRLRLAQDHLSLIPLLTDNGNKAALEDFCGCECLEISKTDIPTLFRKLTSVIRVVSTTSRSNITGPSFARDLMFGD